MACVGSAEDRCPATRNVVVRSDTGSRGVSVKAKLATGGIIAALMVGPTVTLAGYLSGREAPSDAAEEVKRLERAYADLLAESQRSTAHLAARIDRLGATTEHQRGLIRELIDIRESLERQLESRKRELASSAEQRNQARSLLGDLERAMSQVEGLMQVVLADKIALEERLAAAQQRRLEERTSFEARLAAAKYRLTEERSLLEARLATAQARLVDVVQQRDAGRQVEVGLRWQIAQLEDEVDELRSEREVAQLWLKDWVLGSTEALEHLFVAAGVDVEGLIARAGTAELGQGGPLQAAVADSVGARLAEVAPSDPMGTEIQRLAALQKVARTLPLAPPLDHFRLSSPYGKRPDPFTLEWAFHPGLDFSAAAGSNILATAPGRVTHAGRAGPYGNMVEIDHGMGVVTRYGHMKAIRVAVGDEVQFRHEIGVIGNTGRSTALHLHYEIWIDGVAYDPGRFLDAGRFLVGIFGAAGGGPAGEG